MRPTLLLCLALRREQHTLLFHLSYTLIRTVTDVYGGSVVLIYDALVNGRS